MIEIHVLYTEEDKEKATGLSNKIMSVVPERVRVLYKKAQEADFN